MKKYSRDIQARIRKELLLIGSLIFFLSTAGIIIGYTLLHHAARKTEAEHELAVSQLAARGVMRVMDHQFSALEAHTKCRTCEDTITAINALYPADEKKRQAYMGQMSGSFLTSPGYDPAIREHLANEVIPSLSCHTKSGMGIREIVVTDKFGGVAASTGHTKELYQTDKDWWQAAFNKGQGDFAVGEVVFDDKSSSWCLPFAGPIRDKAQGVIGVYRVLLDIEMFFDPVRNIRMGRTGNLSIVDGRNYLLFYPETKPFAQKFCDYKELQKLLTGKTGSTVMNRVFGHTKPVMAGFTRIDNPLLMKRRIEWDVIAMKDTEEIYSGLNRFVVETSILCLILVILAIFATARIFRKTYARPAAELEEWMRRIGKGDLDHKMDVRGGDFIKELAGSLHAMADELKINMVSSILMRRETDRRVEVEGELKKRGENIEQLIKSRIEQSVLSIERALTMLNEDASIQASEKYKHMIDEMTKIASLLKDTVKKLAYMASIDSGGLELKMQRVDARALLKDAVLNFESKISARNLKLNIDIPKTAVDVLADPVRINDALTILLENAIGATKTGSIKMSLRYLPKEAEFAVSDTGRGMAEQEVAALFKRSRSQGIGLFIAKGIIESHKGQIFAKSEQGKGTTIFFRIPNSLSAK
ncbi:MAG: ATP-binding protein [Candidatus Omnitrophica bacterium]|nr:ATP-binding protein [Candidatus Omnitrophota bacterium]